MKIQKFDGLNVVPFLDIMLVLLVIVLTTASFVANCLIPLELPKANSSQENHLQKIEISIIITKENKIYFNHQEQSLKSISQNISAIKDKNMTFKINCDKNAKFNYFVSVLDLIKMNGFNNIAIVTEK